MPDLCAICGHDWKRHLARSPHPCIIPGCPCEQFAGALRLPEPEPITVERVQELLAFVERDEP